MHCLTAGARGSSANTDLGEKDPSGKTLPEGSEIYGRRFRRLVYSAATTSSLSALSTRQAENLNSGILP